MERGVGFDDLDDEIGVSVENGSYEPHPLRGTEEWNRLLDDVEEHVVADFDEFAEEHDLGEEYEGADVDVSAEHGGYEDSDHEYARDEADEYLFDFGFVFFNGALGHCKTGSFCRLGGRRLQVGVFGGDFQRGGRWLKQR